MSPQQQYCNGNVQSWVECELSEIPKDAIENCLIRIKALYKALDGHTCRHPEHHDQHVKTIRQAIRIYCGIMIEIMDKQETPMSKEDQEKFDKFLVRRTEKLDLSDMLLGLGKETTTQ